jgi:hypothetical protein
MLRRRVRTSPLLLRRLQRALVDQARIHARVPT